MVILVHPIQIRQIIVYQKSNRPISLCQYNVHFSQPIIICPIDVRRSSDSNMSPNAVKIMSEMKHLIEGLGELKGRQYKIAMDPMVPPTQNPPYTIPYKLCDNALKELQPMETLGVIEKVQPCLSPTSMVGLAWTHP